MQRQVQVQPQQRRQQYQAQPVQQQQQPRVPAGQVQRVHGRAYALTSEEAAGSATAVTGILFICGIPAFVLIDSGSTHSIVASDLLVN